MSVQKGLVVIKERLGSLIFTHMLVGRCVKGEVTGHGQVVRSTTSPTTPPTLITDDTSPTTSPNFTSLTH